MANTEQAIRNVSKRVFIQHPTASLYHAAPAISLRLLVAVGYQTPESTMHFLPAAAPAPCQRGRPPVRVLKLSQALVMTDAS
jgi:hypothetical protein